MNKVLKGVCLAVSVAAVAMCVAGCSGKHEHVWGEWQSTDTEHYRVCTVKDCNEEQRAAHTWGDWELVGGEHVQKCTVESCSGKQHSDSHLWGEWELVDGEHVKKCTAKSCNTEEKTDSHIFNWTRTKTQHSGECIAVGCEEKIVGTHADSVCNDCAEFRALAFGFTSGGDAAHADFAREANEWFPQKGKELGFIYEYSNDFGKINDENLKNYDIIVLLNNRPGGADQQAAFRRFMDNGGACVAFHASGFNMWDEDGGQSPSSEWEGWFSNTLLRCGSYGYCQRDPAEPIQGTYWNTWHPTSEPLKVETHDHFATENLDCDEFISSPCEWYEWHNDLFADEDTTVLLSLNPTPENPAGDDHRPGNEHQVWQAGHHAIAWANKNYNVVYMNWGHNLQSYNSTNDNNGYPTEGTQSKTFSCPEICQFTLDAMFGLVK